MLECQRAGAQLVVAAGSAIGPLAQQAAELYGVVCARIGDSNRDDGLWLVADPLDGSSIRSDAAAIALADRIDALWVRRGGLIEECLRRRLEIERGANVRVAISHSIGCAAKALIERGAIGWIDLDIPSPDETDIRLKGSVPIELRQHQTSTDWAQANGQWLIHCTRGPAGRWPDETDRQYWEAMLLGPDSVSRRGALDSLRRILRLGRILASAKASHHAYPVVCFSSLSLIDLIRKRCFRSHLGRWDFEPYGVAIRLSAAQSQGVQPVIYGDNDQRDELPEQDRFRFHPRGRTTDWTKEKEWRCLGSVDLFSFDRNDVRVFALACGESTNVLRDCPWEVTWLQAVSLRVPTV
jgi:hypothetical protein